jgi:hypothetical protein
MACSSDGQPARRSGIPRSRALRLTMSGSMPPPSSTTHNESIAHAQACIAMLATSDLAERR